MISLREFKPLVLSELDLSYASRKKKKEKKGCKITGYMQANRRFPGSNCTGHKN